MSLMRLDELAGFRQGKTPSKAHEAYWGGVIPWASSRDIKRPTVDRTVECITQLALDEAQVPVATPGDLLVVNRSGVLVHSVPIAEVLQPTAFNQDITCVSPDRRVVNPSWLRLALASRQDELLQHGVKSGSTVPSIEQDYLRALVLRVPQLDTQQQQVVQLEQKLAFASKGIEGLCAQAEAANRLERAYLRAALGPTPPVGVEPICESSQAQRTPLRGLAQLESGHTPSRRHPEWWGGDVPWLALPDIRKLHGLVAHDTTEHTNDLGLANSSARLLPVGTVCLCRDASIGFVTMLGRPMATSQHFCNWVCDPDKLDAEFLMYAFMAYRSTTCATWAAARC